MFQKIQTYAKLIAAVLTVLVTSGVGLIPGEYIGWVQLVIAVLGAVAVYAVPNAPTPTQKDQILAAHAQLDASAQNADLQAASQRVNGTPAL